MEKHRVPWSPFRHLKLYKDGVAYSSSPVATDFNGLSWAVNLESGSSYQLHLDSNNSDWPGPVIYAR